MARARHGNKNHDQFRDAGSDDGGRDRKSRWLGPTSFGRLLRRCRSSRPLPDLSRQDGVDSQSLPMPSLRLARLVLHVRGASEQCQTHREPTPTSTIAARSGGTPLLPTALLPPEASARRCSLSLAGQLEGRVVSWSRAPFPWRGGQGPTQPAVRGGGY